MARQFKRTSIASRFVEGESGIGPTGPTGPIGSGLAGQTGPLGPTGPTGSIDGQSSEWKNFVPTYNDLPITGNSLGDVKIIADNGKGRSSLYRCVATSGSRDLQWQPIDPNFDVIDGGHFV